MQRIIADLEKRKVSLLKTLTAKAEKGFEDSNNSKDWEMSLSELSEDWEISETLKKASSDIFSTKSSDNHSSVQSEEPLKKEWSEVWNFITWVSYQQTFNQIFLAVKELKESSDWQEKLNEIQKLIYFTIQNVCNIHTTYTEVFTSFKIQLKDVIKETSSRESAFTTEEEYVTSDRAHISCELWQKVWAIQKKYIQQDLEKFSHRKVNLTDFKYIRVHLCFASFSSKN